MHFSFLLHFITLFIMLLSTDPPSRCCTFRNRSAGLMAVFVPLLDTEGPLLIEWNTCSPSRPTRTPQLILLRSLAKSHAFWASYFHCALITILQVAIRSPKGGHRLPGSCLCSHCQHFAENCVQSAFNMRDV